MGNEFQSVVKNLIETAGMQLGSKGFLEVPAIYVGSMKSGNMNAVPIPKESKALRKLVVEIAKTVAAEIDADIAIQLALVCYPEAGGFEVGLTFKKPSGACPDGWAEGLMVYVETLEQGTHFGIAPVTREKSGTASFGELHLRSDLEVQGPYSRILG